MSNEESKANSKGSVTIDFKFSQRHMKLREGWVNFVDAKENFNKPRFSKMSYWVFLVVSPEKEL